jgi:hypothetical protein
MNKPHIIKTVDPKTRAITVKYLLYGFRDFTSTGPHLESLENGQYLQMVNDFDTALHTIGYIKISIYVDASGNTFEVDSNNNPINNRLVKSNSYTYPFIDSNGNAVEGTIIMTFDDGSTFSSIDIDATYEDWYKIYNVNTSLQPFT